MTLGDEAANIISERPELAREIVNQFLRKRRSDESLQVGLTKQQRAALAFIQDYASSHDGMTPSYVEIAAHLRLASKSNVFRLILALEERGYLVRLPNRNRSIKLIGAAA